MTNIDLLRKRLLYQSHHRGIKEMDILLGGFGQQFIPDMTLEELLHFEDLLAFPDQEIYGWLFENAPRSEKVSHELMERLDDFINNK